MPEVGISHWRAQPGLAKEPTLQACQFMGDATRILSQIEQGDAAAAERLLPLVYEELRRLAATRLRREKSGQTLDATALVHEAYLRLVDVNKAQSFYGRGHFFAAAAEAMRRILVEQARHKATLKKGGSHRQVDADPDLFCDSEKPDSIFEIDEALAKLSAQNAAVAKLVELKFFGGLTLEECAAALEISVRTAHRNWAYAKAWLKREIGKESAD